MRLTKAKCPHCGVELEVDESQNVEYYDDQYNDCVNGHCPKCDKNFSWIEEFVYNGFHTLTENFEEEE